MPTLTVPNFDPIYLRIELKTVDDGPAMVQRSKYRVIEIKIQIDCGLETYSNGVDSVQMVYSRKVDSKLVEHFFDETNDVGG